MKTLFLFLVLFVTFTGIACPFDGNETFAGALAPGVAYQTQGGVASGNYYSINVSCGNTYNFNFCNNGGAAGWDTQITILATDGTTQLAYNDDACGLQSNVTWYANFTGTIYVLISQFNCNNLGGSTGATLAYNMTIGATDPSFNLSVSCGGGVATVTGTTGGSFAFNPAPGDGAQVNATTGTVSNGTAGTTYFVEYTVCSNSSIESVIVVDEDCFTLNGNAQYIDVNGEDCIQLTQEINNQTGCAWSGSQIDFNSNFSLSLDYYFGNNINGADGNTFTFQPSSSTACGQNGGQLGAGGIANALVVEFDTYNNDFPAHIIDIACDHIAVEIDGNMLNGAPYCGPVCAKAGGGNIDDGGVYEVEIAWNAATQQLEVYFDGALRLSCGGDFVNTVFGGQNMVYWGATSATGGLNNEQYFCPSTIVILPSELASFNTICNDKSEVFNWVVASESRVDYYQLECTYDGSIFYPIERIEAFGNSTSEIYYSTTIFNDDPKQRYYRLKIVDENGEFENTDLISGRRCAYSSELISTVFEKNNLLSISTSEDVQLTITNQLGQVILNDFDFRKKFEMPTDGVSKGVYFVIATAKNGQQESRKVILM